MILQKFSLPLKKMIVLICSSILIGNISAFLFKNFKNEEQIFKLDFPKLNLEDVDKLQKQEVLFVDARSKDDYLKKHIKGAISIPMAEYDFAISQHLEMLFVDVSIIVYCDGISCSASDYIARKLYDLGIRKIFLLNSSFGDWENAKLPIE